MLPHYDYGLLKGVIDALDSDTRNLGYNIYWTLTVILTYTSITI